MLLRMRFESLGICLRSFLQEKYFPIGVQTQKEKKILKAEAKKDDMLVAEYQLKFKKFG